MQKKCDIFISYRHEKGQVYSSLIYNILKRMGYRVFLDDYSLDRGLFDEQLEEAIRNCTDFISVLSDASLKRCHEPEDWVRREIELALASQVNIIPFIIENYDWISDIAELIRKYDSLKNFDRFEGVSTDDAHISFDVEHRLPRLLKSKSLTGGSLVSHIERPKAVFAGRETEMNDIHGILQNSTNVAFVSGMGGIGKSELAKGYAQKYVSSYETIVYVHYNESILQTFIDDTQIQISNMYREVSDTLKMESRENYFNRKMEAFKKVARPSTLVIIDNFDILPEDLDEEFRTLIDCDCKFLFTTRNDFSEIYPTVFISEKGTPDFGDTALKIFEAYYGKKVAGTDMDKIKRLFDLVNYHTLCIELIAKQMRTNFIRPDKMIKMLEDNGIKALHTKKAAGLSAYDSISLLFDLNTLSDEEKEAMAYLTLMPLKGVNIYDFVEWARLENPSVISDLEKKSLLTVDFENDRVFLHPIIREIACEKLEPDASKCGNLLDSAHTIYEEASQSIAAGNPDIILPNLLIMFQWLEMLLAPEDEFRCAVCETIASTYYSTTCFSEAYEYYQKLCDESHLEPGAPITEHELKLFNRLGYCITNGSENNLVAGYHFRKKLLYKALQFWGPDSKHLLSYYEAVGISSNDMGKPEDALYYRQLIYDWHVKNCEPNDLSLIYSKAALSNVYMSLNRTEEAARLRKEICKQLAQVKGTDSDKYAIALSNYCNTMILLGKHHLIDKEMQQAADIIATTRGDNDFYSLCIPIGVLAARTLNDDPSAISFGEALHDRQVLLWGEDYDVTLKCCSVLAAAYYLSGDKSKAIELISSALQMTAKENHFSPVLIRNLKENSELIRSEISPQEFKEKYHWLTITLLIPGIKNY